MLLFSSSFPYLFIDSLLVYVHDVSPKKKARNNATEYFNMKLQSNSENYQAVSFNVNTHSVFQEAALSKSPVKLKCFKRKANLRDNNIQDIEVNKNTQVLPMASASFDFKPLAVKIAAKRSIKDIKSTGYDRQMVSVHGYVNIDNTYVTIVELKTAVKRRECFLNDDSAIMMLSLWGDAIDKVRESGCYEFSNVSIRDIGLDEPVLSTTSDTTISQLSKKVKQMNPGYQLYTVKPFPILNFSISTKQHRCVKCNVTVNQPAAKIASEFFKCSECHASSRFPKLTVA